jgi:hypothetical protein
MDADLARLDAAALLSAAEANERALRAAEARRLQVAAAWADLHGVPGGPARCAALPGAEQLVRLGGDGAPEVAEFAPAELGAALGMSADAAAALIGDALDLRHRLPALWARVLAGEVAAWHGRRVARITRLASSEAAAAVDRRVAPFAHSLPLGRLENVAQAAMIDADPDAAEQAADAARDRQGVWLAREAVDGYRDVFIRTDAASAAQFDAAVDQAADAATGDADAADADATDDRAGGRRRRVGARPRAVLYVHLTDQTLRAGAGVTRVEGVGPVVAGQAREWLGRCDLTVKPAIDLAGIAPVDGYEVPDAMREAVRLRTPADVFPYANGVSRRMELDHTVPYRPPDEGGPPGQTRPGNLGPMTRRHHRIKTHDGPSGSSATAPTYGDHPTAATTSSTRPAPPPSRTSPPDHRADLHIRARRRAPASAVVGQGLSSVVPQPSLVGGQIGDTSSSEDATQRELRRLTTESQSPRGDPAHAHRAA